jgi:hypothetical protein
MGQINYYLENNIEVYIKDIEDNGKILLIVKYENVPNSLEPFFDIDKSNNNNGIRYFEKSEIIHFSPNKEKLEAIITSKKYNI